MSGVEEKWDEENKCAYFYDPATGATAWSREELEGGGAAAGGEDGGPAALTTAREQAKRAKAEAKLAARKVRVAAARTWASIKPSEQPRIVMLALTCVLSFLGFVVLSAAPCFPNCGLQSLCANKLDDSVDPQCPGAPFCPTYVRARVTFSLAYNFSMVACVLTWLWSALQLLVALSPACAPLRQCFAEWGDAKRAVALEVLLWLFVTCAWTSTLSLLSSAASSIVVANSCETDEPVGFTPPYAVPTPDVCGYWAVLKQPQLAGSAFANLNDLPQLRALCASGGHVQAFIAIGFFLWLVMCVMTGGRLVRYLLEVGVLTKPKPSQKLLRHGGRATGAQDGSCEQEQQEEKELEEGSGGTEDGFRRMASYRARAEAVLASAQTRTHALRLCVALSLFSVMFAAAAPCFSSCTLEGLVEFPLLKQTASYRFLVVTDIFALFWCAGLLLLERPAGQAWLAALTAEAEASKRAENAAAAAAAAKPKNSRRRSSAVATTRRAARRASAAIVTLGSSVMGHALTPSEQAEIKETMLHLLLAICVFFAWVTALASIDGGLGYNAIRSEKSTIAEVCGLNDFLEASPVRLRMMNELFRRACARRMWSTNWCW